MTLSAGVPSTAKALPAPDLGGKATARMGECRVTAVPMPLCSRSGAHTTTSPTSWRASAACQRPGERMPSSLASRIRTEARPHVMQLATVPAIGRHPSVPALGAARKQGPMAEDGRLRRPLTLRHSKGVSATPPAHPPPTKPSRQRPAPAVPSSRCPHKDLCSSIRSADPPDRGGRHGPKYNHTVAICGRPGQIHSIPFVSRKNAKANHTGHINQTGPTTPRGFNCGSGVRDI